MAKFESEGYCPHNCFSHYARKSDNTDKVLAILGSRTAYMVYDEGTCAYNCDPYVVDALLGSTGTTGIEIATAIHVLTPICDYPNTKVKLSCFDMLNPTAIPGVYFKDDHWEVCNDKAANTFLFEDDRFLAVIVKVDEEKLQLYFWKK